MNKKRIIMGLVVIIAVVTTGAFIYQPLVTSGDAVAAAEVGLDSGQVVFAETAVQTSGNTVSAEGVISPLQSANLSFLVGGKVAEILVEEGTMVAEGDPLVRLDAAELELAVQQAEAGITTAEAALMAAQAQLTLAQEQVNSAEIGVTVASAQLDLVKAGPRPEEIAFAEKNIAAAAASISQAAGNRDVQLDISDAQIQAAQASVAHRAAAYNAIQDGYDTIIETCFELPDGSEVCPLYGTTEETVRAELEVAQLQLVSAQESLDALLAGPTVAQQRFAGGSVAVATANRDLAQAQLDLLLAGATPEQIRQVEVGVEQAELSVEQAQTAVIQTEAAVSQAEAGVVQAQAALEAAQSALNRMTLTAPFAGTVANVLLDEGELASTGMPVIVLADMSGWIVETIDLTELDVAAVAVGDSVEVRIDAIDGEQLSGTVTKIASVSSLTRGDVTYAVTIALDANSLPLRWGMTTFVDIK